LTIELLTGRERCIRPDSGTEIQDWFTEMYWRVINNMRLAVVLAKRIQVTPWNKVKKRIAAQLFTEDNDFMEPEGHL
jgi:hypothetical protein